MITHHIFQICRIFEAEVDVFEHQIPAEGLLDLVVDLEVEILVQEHLAQLESDKRPAHKDFVVDHVSPRAANATAALDQALGVQVGENLLRQFQWQTQSHFVKLNNETVEH
jgi:hypothetical protein